MTTVPHPLATVPARSDRGLQRRRRLRLARTRLGLSVQTRLLPTVSASRRTRLHVCGAANTLTALGVRVHVHGPATPWPRTRVVVATGPIGPLGDLAVATVLRGEPIRPAADVPADTTVCPLLVCYRLDGQAGYLTDDDVPRSSAEIAALQGLVVEVHLLSPVPPAAPPPQAVPQLDLADQLPKLAELRDAGILTEEEFTAQKTKLLGV